MADPGSDEMLAFEVVRRVLGVDVEHYNTDGRQGAVDALIRYGDGKPSAALEVTILTDEAAAQIESLLAAEDWKWSVEGLDWAWSVQLGPDSSVKRVREELSDVLHWCERTASLHRSGGRGPLTLSVVANSPDGSAPTMFMCSARRNGTPRMPVASG